MILSHRQFQILAVLAAGGGLPASKVADRIGGLHRSSVYTALAVLQRDGYVSAAWHTDDTPARRHFQLTEKGRATFEVERGTLDRILGR